MDQLHCVFFDRLISPFYHFGGLSFGNVHSMTNHSLLSFPKKTALQCLQKMLTVSRYGFDQYVLLPELRDYKTIFNLHGFNIDLDSDLNKVYDSNISLFSSVFSSSASWVANSFILTSSCDSFERMVQVTPANLEHCFHRKLEIEDTFRQLKNIFLNSAYFNLHQQAPSSFADEGAANMVRLSSVSGDGLYLFVYGKSLESKRILNFPARQSKESFDVLVQQHELRNDRFVYIQQSQKAINSGVFHNDVICFGDQHCLVLHEDAFENQSEVLKELSDQYASLFNEKLIIYEISESELSIVDAVKTYFFNSQFVALDSNQFLLLCPLSCKNHAGVQSCIKQLSHLIDGQLVVDYVDLSESIKNGGGPACLRGFAYLTKSERAHLNPSYLLTESLYKKLHHYISKCYPEELDFRSLKNQKVVDQFQDVIKGLNTFFTEKNY